MNVLVTGAAGFIGSWVSKTLTERGDTVIGIDNLNDYYDPQLKEARLLWINNPRFKFYKADFSNLEEVRNIFKRERIDKICHLGAQAGVRYSITNPFIYEKSNLLGTMNLLEMAKTFDINSFIYASSSSVYGNNKKIPFSERDNVDNPISLYAATKKSNELMAHTYHHIYGINCTGLRFFTVYGPYGRPDMALFKFTESILNDKPIDVYNFGNMKRDFTYITDIVDGVTSAIDRNYECELFNLGNSNSVELEYFISCLENELGKKAKKNLLPMQAGDVPETCADISHAKERLGFEPKVKIEEGIKEFVKWYNSFYRI